MILKLDDYTVPGFGLNVSFSATLKDADASGDTSATARAKKGNKGKRLDVSLSLPFSRADDLRELTRVAEAMEDGDAKLYAVTNDTANAAGIRQARFSGLLRVNEARGLRAWEISFSLAEQESVPEMTEARETPRASSTQSNSGLDIGGGNQPPAAGAAQESGSVELLLRYLNKKLGAESA